jgi:hypothetical protein
MSAPHNIARDYAGGVVSGVQLAAAMGATDTSFTIASTTGWVNASNNPLGTVGPYTVIIDLGTPTAEKILCSAINLSSGVITVYTSTGFSGRGYDQTTAQAHVPGGSVSGVQPCWSAVEAAEANAAVVYGPGGGGAIIGLTGNPAGRVHAVTGTIGMTTAPAFTTVTSDYLRGGMTASTHGLTINTTGWYQVNVNMWALMGGAGTQAQVYLEDTTSSTLLSTGALYNLSAGQEFNLMLNDIVPVTAGHVIAPLVISSLSNATMQNLNNTGYNYISASLVSV